MTTPTRSAVILAAGFGKRMRPLTETCPKPLIKVASKSILDYLVDHLIAYGVNHIFINGHYLADQIESYVKALTQKFPAIHFEFVLEPEAPLETGGSIVPLLPHLPDQFWVLNGDSFWQDVPSSSLLERMEKMMARQSLENLLALSPKQGEIGDYDLAEDGRLALRKGESPYQYMGIRLEKKSIYHLAPAEAIFSQIEIWNQLEKNNTLYGHLLTPAQGRWFHISTPPDVEAASQKLLG